ncbi:MAG: hypothetical protein KDA92_20140, partial [Planctomycetales bacterium]|nr:hypothetical protein [Planctomycetales bacterium]
MIFVSLCSALLLAAVDESVFQEGVRSTESQSAEVQATQFHVPPGFEVQLVAAEPDLQKPMNLAFDGRGRLWVSGSIEYPWAAQGEGRDTIKVLEDTNGDGRADRISTFADRLNIPMGLYPYRDGVIAYTVSEIVFLRDTDHDGKADRREVLYGPLDSPVDTHGMQNAFRRGPDGWLYINHGFANRTTIRGGDGSSIQLHSGNTYRVRLDGSRVEQYSWGQVNPFGSEFTEWGDLVTADCHSKPLTLAMPGAYYSSFGKPHDGLGYAPELMSHHHGSTGLAGVAYYSSGNWPEEYRRNILVGNVVTSRIHRDHLEFTGATAAAVEMPDFLTCDDPWFRPVDLRFGPDGALYIADFYNRIIGHYEVPLTHPGRDRTSGRIWRVVYRGKANAFGQKEHPPSLQHASAQELIEATASPILARQSLAADQLTDRIGEAGVPLLRKVLASNNSDEANESRRLWARWVLHRLGKLTAADRLAALEQESSVRGQLHALRLLTAAAELTTAERGLLVERLQDPRANVQRIAAEAAAAHPHPDQVRALLDTLSAVPPTDVALRHMLRIALRNHMRQDVNMAAIQAMELSATDEESLMSVSLAVPTAPVAAWMLDRLQRPDAVPRDEAHLGELIQHIVRYAPTERVADVVGFARAASRHDVAKAVALFQSLRGERPLTNDTRSVLLREWGGELVSQLVQTIETSGPQWHASGDVDWQFETRTARDGQKGQYLSSLPSGETLTGSLISSPFAAPRELRFFLCGHRGDPNQIASPPGDRTDDIQRVVEEDTYVQLIDAETGRVLHRAFPPRNDMAVEVRWDCVELAGRSVQFELVDRCRATAYAWLAVARMSGPLDSTLTYTPSMIGGWQQTVAELSVLLNQSERIPVLRKWVTQGSTAAARGAAAMSVAQLSNQPLQLVAASL